MNVENSEEHLDDPNNDGMNVEKIPPPKVSPPNDQTPPPNLLPEHRNLPNESEKDRRARMLEDMVEGY
jgi:hypothetical protein